MTHRTLDPDPTLAAALRDATAERPDAEVDWSALGRGIGRRAAPELARRRRHQHLRGRVIAVGIAASLAVLVFGGRLWDRTAGAPTGTLATSAGDRTVDELFDADVTDGQFRALLFGASEAEDLLLIAAGVE